MHNKAKCLVGRRQCKNHALTVFFTWVTKQWRWHFWDHVFVGKCTQLRSWNRQSWWKIPGTAHSPWWKSQRQTVNTFLAQRDFLCTSSDLWRAGWSETKRLQDTSHTGMHCGKQGLKKKIYDKRSGKFACSQDTSSTRKSPKRRGPRESFLLLSTASGPRDKRNSKKKRK